MLGTFSVAGMDQLLVLSVSAHVLGLSVEYHVEGAEEEEVVEKEEEEVEVKKEEVMHTRYVYALYIIHTQYTESIQICRHKHS